VSANFYSSRALHARKYLALQCVGAEGFVNNFKRFDARSFYSSALMSFPLHSSAHLQVAEERDPVLMRSAFYLLFAWANIVTLQNARAYKYNGEK